jgi:hypothetical protein
VGASLLELICPTEVARYHLDGNQAVHQACGRTGNRKSTRVVSDLGTEDEAAVDPSNGRVVDDWPMVVWMVAAPNIVVEGHLKEIKQ